MCAPLSTSPCGTPSACSRQPRPPGHFPPNAPSEPPKVVSLVHFVPPPPPAEAPTLRASAEDALQHGALPPDTTDSEDTTDRKRTGEPEAANPAESPALRSADSFEVIRNDSKASVSSRPRWADLLNDSDTEDDLWNMSRGKGTFSSAPEPLPRETLSPRTLSPSQEERLESAGGPSNDEKLESLGGPQEEQPESLGGPQQRIESLEGPQEEKIESLGGPSQEEQLESLGGEKVRESIWDCQSTTLSQDSLAPSVGSVEGMEALEETQCPRAWRIRKLRRRRSLRKRRRNRRVSLWLR
ncbi:unnamed protein product [Effrenium voratum]|uniref:Uncharacterized protein n=1 Tax=Effrenium voratum TaxID=2562239 RepID=A0AA36NIZ5_9DINO|nr:unnamed protein product [Effrenium voratum]